MQTASRALFLALLAGAAAAQGPTVDVWYGDTQVFGDRGNPQRWVNVLGNVSDPDGVASLSYTLNGGPSQALNMGPDQRRLLEPGDFNVEIDYVTLLDGDNTVVITAVDTLANATDKTVTVQYHAGNVWPSTYSIDWSAAASSTDVAQIVDGRWAIEPDGSGIRPQAIGYDRTFVVGDVSWDDFEVTMPITIHAIDPGGFGPPSTAPGIGFTNRWAGHTVYGLPNEQPLVFWKPQGGNGWYDYAGLQLWLGFSSAVPKVYDTTTQLGFGETWFWKLRSESLPSGDTFYGFKVWRDTDPEPVAWMMQGEDDPADLQSGSLIVVAHHVDATFGNIDVVDLDQDATPPVVLTPDVTVTDVTATIDVPTNEPTSIVFDYGLTTAYGMGPIVDAVLESDHEVQLSGLTKDTVYFYEVQATDGRGNVGTFQGSFQTDAGPPPSILVSDDFSAPAFDAALWTFVDPLGDSTPSQVGGELRIEVPAEQDHDIWTLGNYVPWIKQPHDDGDFEVEVKFSSLVNRGFQSQGVLFEGAGNELLRVEFHHNGSTEKLFVAHLDDFNPTTITSTAISVGAPNYLRVRRIGADWTIWWSSDGQIWQLGSSFQQAMMITAVGPYAGNGNGSAHTARIDYFFNTAAPIDPEDGSLVELQVTTAGGGTVAKSPDQVAYQPGTVVTVTATPDPGWDFDEWQGDLAGSTNPLNVTLNADVVAQAVFTQPGDVTPPVISGIDVSAGQTAAIVSWSTDEPATTKIEYGLTAAYELGAIEDPALKTAHSVNLASLTQGTTYHYRLTAEDGSQNADSTGDLTFSTGAPGIDPSGVTSDDFTQVELDGSVWTFVNPHGDARLESTGTGLRIVVPTGEEHEAWTNGNFLPRIMQPANDIDFQLEAKFETTPDTSFQSEGILIEQDADDYLRSEIHYYNGQTRIYVVSFIANVPTIRTLTVVPDPATPYAQPVWLNVDRAGDQWTVRYSFDGSVWTTAASFTHSLTVAEVGAFSGNSELTAHTATIDYFFSTASPVVPEDDDPSALVVNVLGGGSVQRSPDKTKYAIGESVDLTPVAAGGWSFDHWSGDASGSAAPLSLNLSTSTSVTAVFLEADVTSPTISNVAVTVDDVSALITWDTDEPATSIIDFGLTSGYGSTLADAALVTSHSLLVTGLAPETLYHFQLTSADASGNAASTLDATFTTQKTPVPIVSDDFSQASLQTGLWTFENPFGDATVAMTGTQVEIAIPATPNDHDAWTSSNTMPRLMQTVTDDDFEVIAKLESVVDQDIQMQGLLIEETPLDFIRVELHQVGGNQRIFVAAVFGGAATVHASTSVFMADPMWLRVNRFGTAWDVDYSYDGASWLDAANFTRAMTLSRVGIHAGSSPDVAHTARFDYFFDTAAPISPEDATPSDLVVNVAGEGTVLRSPDKTTYAAGESVTLTPVPAAGWHFAGWSGSAAGSDDPLVVNVASGTSITAHFGNGTSPPPLITSVSPSTIEILQVGTGQTVVLTGIGFTPASSLSVDGVLANNFTVVSDTEIHLAWPLVSAPGPVDVAISTEYGSDVRQVAVVHNATPALQVQSGDSPVELPSYSTIEFTLSGQPNTLAILLYSTSNQPLSYAGLVDLAIGGGGAGFGVLAKVPLGPSGWTQLTPTSGNMAPLTDVWFQMVEYDPAAGPLYPTSNVQHGQGLP